jgi:glycine cleavage system H protein
MDAGIVDYKLCDRQLQCEECPFDLQIRRQLSGETVDHLCAATSSVASKKPIPLSEAAFDVAFEHRLAALTSLLQQPELPADRFYTQNHLWFRNDGERTFTVGTDHLAVQLLGAVSGVAVPTLPAKVHPQSPCAWLILEAGTIAVKCPFEGTVIHTNDVLRDHPYLLNSSPYERGWIIKLATEEHVAKSRWLLSAHSAAELYRRQGDALTAACRKALKKIHPSVGTTMYDGGKLLERIEEVIGPSVYFQLIIHALSLS